MMLRYRVIVRHPKTGLVHHFGATTSCSMSIILSTSSGYHIGGSAWLLPQTHPNRISKCAMGTLSLLTKYTSVGLIPGPKVQTSWSV